MTGKWILHENKVHSEIYILTVFCFFFLGDGAISMAGYLSCRGQAD